MDGAKAVGGVGAGARLENFPLNLYCLLGSERSKRKKVRFLPNGSSPPASFIVFMAGLQLAPLSPHFGIGMRNVAERKFDGARAFCASPICSSRLVQYKKRELKGKRRFLGKAKSLFGWGKGFQGINENGLQLF